MDFAEIAIIVAGPTAVGKTAMGIALAERLGGEIVSADARQIYRGMVVGTCAPVDPPVLHHLVGYLDPRERSSAFHWAKMAAAKLEDIRSRGLVPIVVGGTGLYIRALVEGVFEGPAEDEKLRKSLFERAARGENLHSELESVDPEAAKRIHPNNTVRIIRALEVYRASGKPISENFRETESPAKGWTFVKIFLDRKREELYRRIDERTRALLSGGWIDETRALLDSGLDERAPGMNAIGYIEIARYLRGEIDRDRLIDEVSRKTRNYAKRQITWFSNRPGFRRIDLSATTEESALDGIIEDYRRSNELLANES